MLVFDFKLPHFFYGLYLLALLSYPKLIYSSQEATQDKKLTDQVKAIKLDKTTKVSRRIKIGESHSYEVDLQAGQCLDLAVEQKGVDVAVDVVSPQGKTVINVDSPNLDYGPEPVIFVAEISGIYKITVQASNPDAKEGLYEVSIADIRIGNEKEKRLPEAASLGIQSATLAFENKYDEAIEMAKKAIAIREAALGADHPAVALLLDTLAMAYEGKGEPIKAEALFTRSLAINEKVLGQEHPAIALSILNLERATRTIGDYKKAYSLGQKMIAAFEKLEITDNLLYERALSNFALTNELMGNYKQSEEVYARAAIIFNKFIGTNNRDYALYLSTLSHLYFSKGDVIKAEQIQQEAYALLEKVLNTEEDPDIAYALNQLGEYARAKGEYKKAEEYYRKALQIYEKAKIFGSSLPPLLDNLGLIYTDRGDYAKAEQLHLQAAEMVEKTLGTSRPELADSLQNLGFLYLMKGDYVKAESYLNKTKEIREKTLGSGHPSIALTLNALALIGYQKGDYVTAEKLQRKSLSIREKALGANHIDIATSLNNLALLAMQRKEFLRAEHLLNRALQMRETIMGAEHPLTADTLHLMALLKYYEGKYTTAKALAEKAYSIREKSLMEAHPNLVSSLDGLAKIELSNGNFSQAIEYQSLANEISETDIERNLTTGSERQKTAYLNREVIRKDFTLSLHIQYARGNKKALDTALTFILRYKGRALDSVMDVVSLLRKNASAEDKALLDQLAEVREKISSLVNKKDLSQNNLQQFHLILKALEEQEETLEAKISSRGLEFRSRLTPVHIEDIKNAIPDDSALVEFVSYHPFYSQTKRFGTNHYVAYILKKDGEPVWVDLGHSQGIDYLITAWRKALGTKDSKVQTTVNILGRKLDALIMRPVRKLLGSTQHLFISPDGALNLIPFDALVDEKNKYIVENYTISYLTSGRDLLKLQTQIQSKQMPVVMADADFNSTLNNETNKNETKAKDSPRLLERMDETNKSYGPKLAGVRFNPLKRLEATEQEAATLKEILKEPTVLTKEKATETALKQVSSPSILHIATHGFFLDDKATQTGKGSYSLRIAFRRTKDGDTELEDTDAVRVENPLLRSALFFAGANVGESGKDDGVLTALEAGSLDLWGTKLVVLSACDTGLGEVRNGEGVYGLRRALFIAGAETQVISLWPVSDKGTSSLMIDYYKRLQKGESRVEALHNAQLSMLASKDRNHPFYWASFIQSGGWTGLKVNQ